MMETKTERQKWEHWCEFTDAAEVPPDTVRDADELADRYFRKTGRLTTAEAVEALMPEK